MSTLAELGQSTSPIEETYGLARIEWADCWPMIVWDEHMGFHLDLARENGVHIAKYGTAHFGHILRDRVAEILVSQGLTQYEVAVRESDMEPEDGRPFMEIYVCLAENGGELPGDTTEEEAYNLLYPAIACLINMTDPGTFNHPYLFSGLYTR